jgi:hypothetical protein
MEALLPLFWRKRRKDVMRSIFLPMKRGRFRGGLKDVMYTSPLHPRFSVLFARNNPISLHPYIILGENGVEGLFLVVNPSLFASSPLPGTPTPPYPRGGREYI